MTKLRRALLAVIVTGAALIAGTGVATPAQASGIGILGCQSTYAYVYPYTGPPSGYHCSGTYNLSVTGVKVTAGGWSGYTVADGITFYFCDWDTQTWTPYAHITKLYLSATKASWC